MLVAHMFAAYVAGDKMSRLQLGIVSFVFVAAAVREVLLIAAIGIICITYRL